MSKAKKHRKASRRPNPVKIARRVKRQTHRRHRNPSRTAGFLSGSVGMFKFGLLALLGLVVTRQVPQFALGTQNAGWLGYGANFATAFAASLGARKVLGKEAANAIAVGGMLYTVERILREKFSPIGQALSLAGVGDANASGSMGRLTDMYSPMPVLRDRAGAPIIPREIDARAAVASIQSAGGASRVSGFSRVSGGRV